MKSTNKTIIVLISALILAVLCVVNFQNKDSNTVVDTYMTFMQTQKEFSISVLTATDLIDGVHFEDGGEDHLVSGPKTYSVQSDQTVWIDDTPAMRRIHVNSQSEIIEIDAYEHGAEPIESLEQDLVENEKSVYETLKSSPVYKDFEVSEIYFWGTSSEGYQYWQTTERKQDGLCVSCVHSFVYVLDSYGNKIAFMGLPVDEQYSHIFYNGVFIDPKTNGAYFMQTMKEGVVIQSVGWTPIN